LATQVPNSQESTVNLISEEKEEEKEKKEELEKELRKKKSRS
jgi:hypothetical protein